MSGKTKILVVDDDPASRALSGRVLKEAGYEIQLAENGMLALAGLEKHLPDLILLDMRMPGLSGAEVLQKLKSQPAFAPVPVIMVSAFSEVGDWVEGLKHGAADFVTKPYQPEELLNRVRTHLALAQSERLSREAAALREANERLAVEIQKREAVEAQLRQSLRNAELAEEQLRESQGLFRLLVETTSEGVWSLDAHGFTNYANPAIARMLACKVEDIQGKSISDYLFPEDQVSLADHLTTRRLGKDEVYEHRYRRSDGTPIWLMVSGKSVQDKDGGYAGAFAIMTDITLRKQAEIALRESEARFRMLVEKAPDAIFLQTKSYFTYVNAATVRLFEAASEEQIVGHSILERVHPDFREHVRERMRRTNEDQQSVPPVELKFLRLNGASVDVEVSAVPADYNQEHGAVVFVRDITDRKRRADVQAFLAHSAERAGEFFRLLARFLAECLGMDFVCIDRLLKDRLTAQTVAIFHDGNFQDNVTYALQDTPCHEVAQGGVCCYPAGVRRRFPLDSVLQDLRAESYVGTVLYGSGGQPVGLIAVIGRQPLANPEFAHSVLQMVAGRAAIELEREESEARLRQWADAFEHCAHGIAMGMAGVNQILMCNPALARMLGRTVEEVAGRPILSLYDPRDHERIMACITEADNTGQVRYESRMVRKDGSTFPVQMDVVSVRQADGKVLYRIATIQDIAWRKRAEAESHAVEALAKWFQQRLSLEELGPKLAECLAETLDFPIVILELDASEPNYSHILGAVGVPELVGGMRLPGNPNFSGTVATSGKELHEVWAGQVPQALAEPLRKLAVETFIAVPLWFDGEPGGTIAVADRVARPDAPTWIASLKTIATALTLEIQRKRMEHELRESSERFRGTLDAMLEGCQIISRDWRYLYVNSAAAQQGRSTVEALLGRTMMEMYPAIEKTPMFADLKRCMQERQAHKTETEFIFPDGARGWFQLLMQPVPDGMFVLSLDITERKRAEWALAASEERLRTLVENAPFGLFVQVDESFVFANRTAIRLLGAGMREALIGKSALERFVPGSRELYQTQIRSLEETRRPVPVMETKCWRLDGAEFEAEISAVPFVYDGRFGALVFFQDITERKRLEAQLWQAQKLEAVGQLAGGVAHDFNNILAAIMMNLHLLQIYPKIDDEVRGALKDLEAEGRRAIALTRQLLMFSRRSVLAIKPLDLNEVVANLLKMLSRLVGENYELRFEGQDSLPTVEADAGLLEQVLMNLVVNARDAMPKGGRIVISTLTVQYDASRAAQVPERRPGRFVSLMVSDSGCGMDADTQKRIFEPFFTTKEAGKGTGLGLATVHGIVAQHQGWLEVESQVGKGTVFRVLLPEAENPPLDSKELAAAQASPSGRETILLVEDEATVRRLVAQELKRLGYQVHEAANGQAAIKLWQQHGPQVDLLLTDMVMPEGMTGLELAEKLRLFKPHLKVIISSGYSTEIALAGMPMNSGFAFLPKPYEADHLAKFVRNCLDER